MVFIQREKAVSVLQRYEEQFGLHFPCSTRTMLLVCVCPISSNYIWLRKSQPKQRLDVLASCSQTLSYENILKLIPLKILFLVTPIFLKKGYIHIKDIYLKLCIKCILCDRHDT